MSERIETAALRDFFFSFFHMGGVSSGDGAFLSEVVVFSE